MVERTFNFIVNGGEATGGPPIGPALGPLGVNIMAIVNKINEETAEYRGVPVPVDVTIDTDTREFSVRVGMLPNTDFVGDLAFDQVIDIARRKRDGLFAASLKAAVREIVGSCQSMGVTVDGQPAREVQALIGSGEYDPRLAEAA
jgi:large subunit ribosomal protein L11